MKTPPQIPALFVRNFGPIKTGFEENDGFLYFPDITVFCGPQGSGKSTLAKLYSTCSWIEKNVFRNRGLTKRTLLDMASFRSSIAWQGLDDYFQTETEIVFRGRYLTFRYALGKLTSVATAEDDSYSVPKILYMPAERNIASVVRDAPGIKTLPQPLQELIVEFEVAKRQIPFLRLPVNGFAFRFDRQKNESWIVNGREANSSQTHLELASSGLQSMVPLLLITEYIEKRIRSGTWKADGFGRSPSEVIHFRKVLEQLMEESASDSSDSGSDILRFMSSNVRFVNIVEEPEQNLFPPAQDAVMNRLFEIANEIAENQLVACTHSPYLVNHLVLSAKASELYRRLPGKESALFRKLKKIVPPESAIGIDRMALYETSEDGSVSRLAVHDGVFGDDNDLNEFLGNWNKKFEKLLDIEDDLSDGN